ncbi:MAG: hypothetical protein V2I54_14890 [Bacteroidales bacterium]|jgi:hypothetical protein|nr:hypothetical protein [Bacteroidales bacterium]
MKKELNHKFKNLQGKNNNPFSVPEGYFEDFPSRVQHKIASASRPNSWIIQLFHVVKPQLALGFMIAAFAFIALTTVDIIMSKQVNSSVSNEVYTRIIEVDASEYSEQQFIDILLEEEKKSAEQEKEATDEYIHYLMDEGIDYGTLIDEL